MKGHYDMTKTQLLSADRLNNKHISVADYVHVLHVFTIFFFEIWNSVVSNGWY